MAIQASRDHLVLFLVTGGALQSAMFALACLQQLERIFMTGGALCRSNLLCVDNRHRLVCTMTGETISLDHLLGMRFMTIGALWNTTMCCRMTINALQTLMFGLAGIKLLENTIVTGAALDGGNLVTINDRRRAVRSVTEFALVGRHLRRMRLMTLTTQGNLTVLFFVTGGTSQFAVFGRTADQSL